MNEALMSVGLGGLALTGLGIFLYSALKAWNGWLELKRLELTAGQQQQQVRGPALERIEVADLKERIRKLESIAACIDL